jgi:hypothetical protein
MKKTVGPNRHDRRQQQQYIIIITTTTTIHQHIDQSHPFPVPQKQQLTQLTQLTHVEILSHTSDQFRQKQQLLTPHRTTD